MTTHIISKEITLPRLTLAKDEARIKLPVDKSNEDRQVILDFFKKVIDDLSSSDEQHGTLRSKIFQGELKMLRDNKSVFKTFKFTEDEQIRIFN